MPALPSAGAGAAPRRIDQALGELRASAEPLTQSALPIGRETVAIVQAATTMAFYLRQLSTEALRGAVDGEGDAALAQVLRLLAARLRGVDASLRAPRALEVPPPVRPHLDALRATAVEGAGTPPIALELMLLALERIDMVVSDMAAAH